MFFLLALFWQFHDVKSRTTRAERVATHAAPSNAACCFEKLSVKRKRAARSRCAVSLRVLRAVIVDRVLDALGQVAPTERFGQTVLDAEVLDLVLEEHQA